MTEWISIALAEEWIKIALVGGAAAFFGTLVGAWLSRPRARGGGADAFAQASPAQIEKPTPEEVALRSYKKILEDKDLPSKELDTKLREFGRQFGELREKLHELSADDAGVQALLEEARAVLDTGDFGRTVTLLDEAGESDAAAGRELRKSAEKRLRTAATAKGVAGDLHLAQLAYEKAARCYQEAVDALPGNSETLLAEYLNKHGTAAYHAGDHATATASFEKALNILEATLGESHPEVATGLNNLALLHYSQADYEAAEPLYERALAIDEKTLGPDHSGVATDLNNLALLYKKQGNFEAAEPLFKRALEIKEKVFEPGHPALISGLMNYATLLRVLDRVEDAEALEARAAVLAPKRTEVAAE
ncbi:MAG: tetratricopeptide repeat protein [Alphaproteobacteria bacterium]